MHVLIEPVADKDALLCGDRELGERAFEDRRRRLLDADLAREDDRVDALRYAEPVQLATDEPCRLRPVVGHDPELPAPSA